MTSFSLYANHFGKINLSLLMKIYLLLLISVFISTFLLILLCLIKLFYSNNSYKLYFYISY